MKEKNLCNIIGSFANNLYGPSKKTLCDFLENKNNCLDFFLLELIEKYVSFTKYNNCSYIVIKKGINDKLYIIDTNFCDRDIIELNIPNHKYNEPFLSLCYDHNSCKIYIAQKSNVFSVTIDGDYIADEINDYTLKSIVTENDCVNVNKCCKQNLKVLKPCICSIGFSNNSIFVIYEKYKSTFISKLTKSGNLVNDQYIDDEICSSYIIDCDCELYIIANKNECLKFIYTFYKSNPLCKSHKNYCEIVLNSECRVDIECPDIPCNLDGCLCEVVRSIALIEKGIAKLITCESEKIKCAIENTVCNDELIAINNSVSKTIMNITMLEQMLKEKLEIAISLHNECK